MIFGDEGRVMRIGDEYPGKRVFIGSKAREFASELIVPTVPGLHLLETVQQKTMFTRKLRRDRNSFNSIHNYCDKCLD